jgi:hypothetical protein
VVEDYAAGVERLGGAADLGDLAAAGVVLGIGAGAAADSEIGRKVLQSIGSGAVHDKCIKGSR